MNHLISVTWYDAYLLTTIREREFDFSIETTWSKKGWVQSILSIRGHDNFDVHWLVETIHLIQKFEKDTLNFTISTCLSVKSFRCNRIDFIYENNWRRVFLQGFQTDSDWMTISGLSQKKKWTVQGVESGRSQKRKNDQRKLSVLASQIERFIWGNMIIHLWVIAAMTVHFRPGPKRTFIQP